MTLRVLPIDAVIADQVRRELRSPQYGHPATVERARSYGPCRQCLRTFRSGEEDRILFTYNPVPKDAGLPDPGPVFIHKDPCTPFEGVERGDVEAAAARMLADRAIDYVQLRNAEAGCFIARIERDQPATGISSSET